MGSLNQVNLIGNVGQDPEQHYTPAGLAITNVSVATNRKWKDKEGEQHEEAEWHKVVFFSKLAEIVNEYIRKGSTVYVGGRLRTRKWEKDGVTRYSTEIVGEQLVMLGPKRAEREAASAVQPDDAAAIRKTAKEQGAMDDFGDSVPF